MGYCKTSKTYTFSSSKGSASAKQGKIFFLSWNRKVQPILASTSINGTTLVWDVRKQKPIISFSDSVRRRCSVLQWYPDFATQLIVASDNDSSPSLRIWDMCNTMSRLRELVGHNKGVVTMSWCPSDSSYLLTGAKDDYYLFGLILLRSSPSFHLAPTGILMFIGIQRYEESYQHLPSMGNLAFITLRLVLYMVLVRITMV